MAHCINRRRLSGNPLSLLNVAHLPSFGETLNTIKNNFLEGSYNHEPIKTPHILLHSGRTDQNGGHRDLLNRSRLGRYHYHHGQPPHMPCCRRRPGNEPAFIVNPYTGTQIALGEPYIFENQAYYSMNLVAQALTAIDGAGVTIFADHFDDMTGMDAGFFACNRGRSDPESFMSFRLGEFFLIVFPRTIFGNLRNNTLFNAEGNAGGSLQLLCHTTRADLDTIDCFAYVTLESIRQYMTAERFFTEFTPNEQNVWTFDYGASASRITSPTAGAVFQIGSNLNVRGSVMNASSARLLLNGTVADSIDIEIGATEVEFNIITLSTAGSQNLSVEVLSRNGSVTILPPVTINVITPSVNITSPADGNSIYIENPIVVSATISGGTRTELIAGGCSQIIEHSHDTQQINFGSIEFGIGDVGTQVITVITQNSNSISVSAEVSLSVEIPVPIHPLQAISVAAANELMSRSNFEYEWELPIGYIAASKSTISYTGTGNANPMAVVNVLGTPREVNRWIFIQEPGRDGRLIGVPAFRNMSNNGGTDTGHWSNIRTILGGTATQRMTGFVIPGSANPAVAMRTVLHASILDAMYDMTTYAPHFRMTYSGSVANRPNNDNRTHNHPNGLAIDINYGANSGINAARNVRRLEAGINEHEPHLISADVERALNKHGWQAGYRWETPVVRGFFHWTVCGT